MKPSQVFRLTLTAQARDALRAAARASGKKEKGGILVGYREGESLHVEDALRVTDDTAARTRYLRRSAPAAQLLQQYMSNSGDPFIGYVGEWHTHPLPLPPSPTDRSAMRLMSVRNRQPVALIVAALEPDKRAVRLFGLVSEPHPAIARAIGRHHEVPVVHA